MLNNAFWVEQFMAVPIDRRLLLLPRCLSNLQEVNSRAEELNYKIYIADGTPIVVKIIEEENMDAILGVGCLDSLEKAFDKVRQLGIPAIAVPLNFDGCKETDTDTEFLYWFMENTGPRTAARIYNYLPLLRTAHKIFTEPESSRLLGGGAPAETVSVANDWLMLGGKRLRPLITLACYRALAGGDEIPFGVKKVALAIEAFHKASLIHDDIEDDGTTRYDRETLHRRYGVPVAINVGDYLVGLGYRLAATAAEDVGAEVRAGLFEIFSDAHMRLSLGQGAELLWQKAARRELDLAAAIGIYAQKTAPAFEAAFASAAVLAGEYEKHRKLFAAFSNYLGAAFQIDNDLGGWGADALHVRPTVLLALALERCSDEEKAFLFEPPGVETVAAIYRRRDVFSRARILKERFRRRAAETAEKAHPERLSDLLHFLVETILQ